MNFYKRHLGDYAKDTPHLSMIEHGAYGLLLDYCYATERGLPSDLEACYRICRAISKQEQAAVRSIVEQFFPVAEDELRHNKRCDQELAKAGLQREINRETGKRGGRPKKTESVSEEITESDTEKKTESVSETEPNRNPSQTPDSRLQRKPSPPTPSADAEGANGHDLLGVRPSKRQRRRKPVTDVPTDFELTDELYDWANARGISDDEVMHETQACLNHHQGLGNMRADWVATWRTWMLNHVKFRKEREHRRAS